MSVDLQTARHLVSSQEAFTPFALEQLEGRVYDLAPHQKIICDTLDKVISGEIKRLIINIPPGYSKTAIAVWSFVARGFAINPARNPVIPPPLAAARKAPPTRVFQSPFAEASGWKSMYGYSLRNLRYQRFCESMLNCRLPAYQNNLHAGI